MFTGGGGWGHAGGRGAGQRLAGGQGGDRGGWRAHTMVISAVGVRVALMMPTPPPPVGARVAGVVGWGGGGGAWRGGGGGKVGKGGGGWQEGGLAGGRGAWRSHTPVDAHVAGGGVQGKGGGWERGPGLVGGPGVLLPLGGAHILWLRQLSITCIKALKYFDNQIN